MSVCSKVGYRVRYLGEGDIPPDVGTITRSDADSYNLGGWWAKWDSNGQELWFSEDDSLFIVDALETIEVLRDELQFLRNEVTRLKILFNM